jgi:hypothetical protein
MQRSGIRDGVSKADREGEKNEKNEKKEKNESGWGS